jgi:Ran GTPase-activating protein (RanGAP) involved in mRNA processing and transport
VIGKRMTDYYSLLLIDDTELRMSATMLPGNLLEKILQTLPSLTSLDLSDNDFGDEGIIDVCEALKNHKSIIELKLDRNWVHRSKLSEYFLSLPLSPSLSLSPSLLLSPSF